MSSSTSLNIIAICQILLTLGGIVAVAALVYGVLTIKKLITSKVDEALNRVQPIVDQAKSIVDQAHDTTQKVSEKVEAVVNRAESTVDNLTDKVDVLSNKVEQSINPQVIAMAGVVGTAIKCAQIYKETTTSKAGDGAEHACEE